MRNSIPPKLFIPGIREDKVDEVFDGAIDYSRRLGVCPTGAKIFKLRFMHDGEPFEAEVGKPHPYYPNVPEGKILLIIEQGRPSLYDVQAIPSSFLVGKLDTLGVTYFTEEDG